MSPGTPHKDEDRWMDWVVLWGLSLGELLDGEQPEPLLNRDAELTDLPRELPS